MKNLFTLSTLFAATLLTSTVTLAEQAPNWNFVQANYSSTDANIDDEGDFSFMPSGFGLSGSKTINDDFFVVASYQLLSDDINFFGIDVGSDLTTYNFGLGYRYAISKTTDFYGVISYESAELEAFAMGDNYKESDNGYGLSAGVRSMLTDSFELTGGIVYVDLGDGSDTALTTNAFYHFNSNFSVGAGYTYSSDADTLSLSARYSF